MPHLEGKLCHVISIEDQDRLVPFLPFLRSLFWWCLVPSIPASPVLWMMSSPIFFVKTDPSENRWDSRSCQAWKSKVNGHKLDFVCISTPGNFWSFSFLQNFPPFGTCPSVPDGQSQGNMVHQTPGVLLAGNPSCNSRGSLRFNTQPPISP